MDGVVFNLDSQTLSTVLEDEINLKMTEDESSIVDVCEIGAGNGDMLYNVAIKYKGQRPHYIGTKDRLHTTMTTLIHHEDDSFLGRENRIIDQIRTMAVELPPDDFQRRFDILAAQNSVFYWSQYPELAVTNMWKMLKEKGVVLATIPRSIRDINGKPFDLVTFLKSSPLFEYEEVENGRASRTIRLKRKDISENDLIRLLLRE
jgi:SAM-dependent methyltransferase